MVKLQLAMLLLESVAVTSTVVRPIPNSEEVSFRIGVIVSLELSVTFGVLHITVAKFIKLSVFVTMFPGHCITGGSKSNE